MAQTMHPHQAHIRRHLLHPPTRSPQATPSQRTATIATQVRPMAILTSKITAPPRVLTPTTTTTVETSTAKATPTSSQALTLITIAIPMSIPTITRTQTRTITQTRTLTLTTTVTLVGIRTSQPSQASPLHMAQEGTVSSPNMGRATQTTTPIRMEDNLRAIMAHLPTASQPTVTTIATRMEAKARGQAMVMDPIITMEATMAMEAVITAMAAMQVTLTQTTTATATMEAIQDTEH